MNGWIGITIGDVTGIGPEVTLKALAATDPVAATRYLLIGDPDLLLRLNDRLDLGLPLKPFRSDTSAGRFFMLNPGLEPLPDNLPPGSPMAARAAITGLTDAAQRCLRLELDAMVTAPVNKRAIIQSGLPFVGQTEFLSGLAGVERTAMMLLGADDRGRWLRVALATTHVPLKLVSERLSQAQIELVIELASKACADLKLGRARVGVCGLNPHAGEGGELGTEEQTLIAPAVQAMQRRGINVVGPLPADSLFHQAYRGDYEAVVAMYHDQGLAPLKMIGFETGINWTLGLPFIRTSPDHGTAYEIAGQNKAHPGSMIAALELARKLARHDGSSLP